MAKRLLHVLVLLLVLLVEDHDFGALHVHKEAILGQQFLLLDWDIKTKRREGVLLNASSSKPASKKKNLLKLLATHLKKPNQVYSGKNYGN